METHPRHQKSTAGGWIAMIFSVAVIFFSARHSILALITGEVSGRFGAIYSAPDKQYYGGIAAGLIGVVLGLILLRMGWRWVRGV